MVAHVEVGFERNEELWSKAEFTHAPRASATTQRMADEDVHPSQCPLQLLGPEQEVGEGERLRRFAKSRLIHRIAIKTSGAERLAKSKEHFFRAAVSMSEQRNRMWTRRRGEKSKRGCVCRQHYFFDANARVDHAREYGPQNQGDYGCCNDPTVSASIHSISLLMSFPQPVTFGLKTAAAARPPNERLRLVSRP